MQGGMVISNIGGWDCVVCQVYVLVHAGGRDYLRGHIGVWLRWFVFSGGVVLAYVSGRIVLIHAQGRDCLR